MSAIQLEDLSKKLAEVVAENIASQERLRTLELSIKGLRRGSLILMLILLAALFEHLFAGSRTFSGRWLAVHNRKGLITGWWDNTGLELHDEKGTLRAKLSLMPDGSPYLQFYDQSQHIRSQLFLYTDGSGYLMLWDKDGKGVRYPSSKTPLP